VITPFWTTRSAILVLNLLNTEARRSLVLDDEAFDWLSATSRAQMIERSHHGELPIQSLLAVEDPGVALAFRGRCQAAGRSGATSGSVMPKQPIFSKRAIGAALLFLLFRPGKVDGAHRQAALDAEECRDRRVDARHLHSYQASEQRASASAAVALKSNAADVQFLESGQQFEREGVFSPVLVNDWRDLGLHETHAPVSEALVPRRSRFQRVRKKSLFGAGSGFCPCPVLTCVGVAI